MPKEGKQSSLLIYLRAEKELDLDIVVASRAFYAGEIWVGDM